MKDEFDNFEPDNDAESLAAVTVACDTEQSSLPKAKDNLDQMEEGMRKSKAMAKSKAAANPKPKPSTKGKAKATGKATQVELPKTKPDMRDVFDKMKKDMKMLSQNAFTSRAYKNAKSRAARSKWSPEQCEQFARDNYKLALDLWHKSASKTKKGKPKK